MITTMGLWASTIFAAGVSHAVDRLDQPAVMSHRAVNSPIMKLARAGERVVAVGARGHILYSDDDGVTWIQAASPVRTTLTGVTFVDSEWGWVVGHDTVVLRTTDGGKSWQRVLDGRDANSLREKHLRDSVEELERKLGVAEPSSETLEDKLEIAQRLLDEAERDLEIGPHKPLLAVAFLDRRRGMAVGPNGLVLGTTDGGIVWDDWSMRLENDLLLHYYGATTFGSEGFFIVGESGEAHRSNDGGITWGKVDPPTDVSLFGAVASPRSDRIFAFGMAGSVYQYSVALDNWNRVETGLESILQGGYADAEGRLYIAGMESTVLRQAATESSLEDGEITAFSINTDILPRTNTGGAIISGDGGVRAFVDSPPNPKPVP